MATIPIVQATQLSTHAVDALHALVSCQHAMACAGQRQIQQLIGLDFSLAADGEIAGIQCEGLALQIGHILPA